MMDAWVWQYRQCGWQDGRSSRWTARRTAGRGSFLSCNAFSEDRERLLVRG